MHPFLGKFLALAFSQPILANSTRIALVVGTLLNAINQGERLVSGGDILWTSLLLNYLIPFCVASYSAVRLTLHRIDNR